MKKAIRALPWIQRSAIFAVCLFGLAAWDATSGAHAAVLSVTTLDDGGDSSLRQAIAEAAPGDTITFAVEGTIRLTGGPLIIGKNLEIAGPGAKILTISGNHAGRVFVIQNTPSNTSVILSGMTISDGLANFDPSFTPPLPQGIGGGILNRLLGRLTLSNVTVSNSRALGDAGKNPAGYYGAGYGGGAANLGGTLWVIDSTFVGNFARGGDGSSGPVAGIGGGGALFSSGQAFIEGSRFTRNQAIGGNDCYGPFLTGHGAAGAVLSGGFTTTLLDVTDSVFDHNQAIGGDGNRTDAPGGLGPGKASGGAVDITGGTGTFSGCTLEHNLSVGGSAHSGGIGSGGGLMVTNVGNTGSSATVSNSLIRHNKALGGPGGSGGDGGDGEGGAFTCIQGATLTVNHTSVEHNHAQGGESGAGGNGGNGQGGGLYEDAVRSAPPLPGPLLSSSLILEGAIVRFNLALAGEAADIGFDGTGVGGGVYRLGLYSEDENTVIKKNQATTGNDSVGP